MLKRSGRFLCSQNLNWNLGNRCGECTIKRPSTSFLLPSFHSSFLLYLSCSVHMASRRQSESSYVCVLAPSNTLFETVHFRILRIDWCFEYILIGSFLGLH